MQLWVHAAQRRVKFFNGFGDIVQQTGSSFRDPAPALTFWRKNFN